MVKFNLNLGNRQNSAFFFCFDFVIKYFNLHGFCLNFLESHDNF